MTKLIIAPLSVPGSITEASRYAIEHTGRLFLQTADSPCAAWIKEAGLPYVSMDDLYDGSFDYDELNRSIAARLMCGCDAVYAVPGRGIGESQLSAIREAAERGGAALRLLPGIGYSDAALSVLPITLSDRRAICAANAIPDAINPFIPLCIEEMDTRLCAGDVKLALLEHYPDEYAVYFCDMGPDGEYRAREIPLFELDRQGGYSAATCCIVPPAASQDRLNRGDMNGLMAVLRRLRAPGGCPWDAKQTHESLRSGLIEEAYEVIDAIDSGDPFALCEELGDLLLHVGMHTVIEEEQSSFTMLDVTSGIINKMIYRHPHVFGTAEADTPEQVLNNWEKLKKKEKHMESCYATMEAVPKGFPALMRAAKIQKKAANVGFDWDNAAQALYKLPEEVGELSSAMAEGDDVHIDEEMGDVFFAAVNVARLLGRDPEQLLNAAADKFMARFKVMEELVKADSLSLEDMPLDEMDRYWDKAKEKLK